MTMLPRLSAYNDRRVRRCGERPVPVYCTVPRMNLLGAEPGNIAATMGAKAAHEARQARLQSYPEFHRVFCHCNLLKSMSMKPPVAHGARLRRKRRYAALKRPDGRAAAMSS